VHPLAQFVQDRFPDAVTGVNEAFGELTISLRKDRLVPVCRTLRDDPAWRFNFLSDVLSLDFPDDEERFEVVYHLYSIEKRHRVRLKARVSEDDCRIESVTPLWPGANFMEREVYDLMGIEFLNHPDHRRILLTDDFDGHPLRKDYPTEGKGWRNTFEFLPKGEGPAVL
jgi:NADH-quinone oxidoreductase subunit C